MSIKNDVIEFLHLYANLTECKIEELEDIIILELSPVEKRKHLLSQIKFSFSKEICQRENTELLTVSNKIYQNILNEAKKTGIVTVSKSYEIKEPIILIEYLVKMKCKNHLNEKIKTIALSLPTLKSVPSPTNWSEIDTSEAVQLKYDTTNFSTKLRETLIENISEMKFRFEDETERRKDRERTIINNYYQQLKKERENAAKTVEMEVKELTKKMQNTKVMKVYESCKKKIEALKNKINVLETSKTHDLEIIIKEYETALKQIQENFKIEITVDLLNGLIILPVNISD